jgi:hypothetical protein
MIRRLLAEFQRADDLRESPDLIKLRAQAVMERADGWKRRFVVVFRSLAGLEPTGYEHPTNIDWRRQMELYDGMLRTDLSIRLFEHDHGRLPETLNELVPDYLPAVPLDLLAKSREPLRYCRDGDNFSVYSVGKDGADNGGVFGAYRTYGQQGYDCNLETWAKP